MLLVIFLYVFLFFEGVGVDLCDLFGRLVGFGIISMWVLQDSREVRRRIVSRI